VAGASLSIDYVLTVAVSVAACIAALTSYFPGLDTYRVPLCLVALLLVMVANLRGVSSSVKLLSFPTYLFMGVVMVMLVAGAVKAFGGTLPALSPEAQTRLLAPTLEAEGGQLMAIGPVLLMRAFSSGCAALTGIEAISDSVAAFRPVEWRNARKVLTMMVLLLATMFGGISALAHHTGIVYADFPRLAAFLAQDGFLPRQLASLGDRLVFSNGIFALSGCAALLLVIFNASVTQLIPLYAVGVFISFTLSQAGMVVHWWKGKGQGWLGKALVNGVGAAITAVVSLVLLYSKFTYGAWLVLLAIPLLITLFLRIRNHYDVVARRLRMSADKLLKLPDPPVSGGMHTVVLVGQLHRGSFEAIRFARSVASDLAAVHVDLGGNRTKAFIEQWERQMPDVRLVVLDSPYRSLVDPVVDFVKQFELDHRKDRNRFCMIVLPVFVTQHRWENLLHNQSTILLRQALREQGTRVVTTVGFYL
jgi:amino acid transporter